MKKYSVLTSLVMAFFLLTGGANAASLQDQIDDIEEQIQQVNDRIDTIELTPGPEGPQGPPGEACDTQVIGVTGPTGPQGPPGTPGVSGYEVVVGETEVSDSGLKQLIVECPAGKKALGAGWGVLDPTDAILDGMTTYFQPAYDGTHWIANAINKSLFAPEWKLRVRVLCASVEE